MKAVQIRSWLAAHNLPLTGLRQIVKDVAVFTTMTLVSLVSSFSIAIVSGLQWRLDLFTEAANLYWSWL